MLHPANGVIKLLLIEKKREHIALFHNHDQILSSLNSVLWEFYGSWVELLCGAPTVDNNFQRVGWVSVFQTTSAIEQNQQ